MSKNNNWKSLKIKELGRVVTGKTPLTAIADNFGYEYLFITPSDMDGRKRIEDTERKISSQGAATLKSYILPANSVCVSCIGWQMGKVVMTTKISFTNQQINTIITNDKTIPDFLYYSLSTMREELKLLGSVGTRTPILNKSSFEKVEVFLPPLPTQQKIASILSAYDDLIENNTKRIKILEEMAQNLYHEWFVKFKFPGYEKVPMVESELGLIPEGWLGKLENALILQRGFDLPNQKRQEGNVPIYAATGITGWHNEAKVKAPGVVTGRSGSLGTVMYVDEDFWALNTTLWVKEFRKITPIYAFYLLKGLGLEQYNSGAAVPSLNRNDVHGVAIIIPSKPILEEFNDYIEPLFKSKKNLVNRNQNLRQTRDLLLSKLISGEIDVENIGINTLENVA